MTASHSIPAYPGNTRKQCLSSAIPPWVLLLLLYGTFQNKTCCCWMSFIWIFRMEGQVISIFSYRTEWRMPMPRCGAEASPSPEEEGLTMADSQLTPSQSYRLGFIIGSWLQITILQTSAKDRTSWRSSTVVRRQLQAHLTSVTIGYSKLLQVTSGISINVKYLWPCLYAVIPI